MGKRRGEKQIKLSTLWNWEGTQFTQVLKPCKNLRYSRLKQQTQSLQQGQDCVCSWNTRVRWQTSLRGRQRRPGTKGTNAQCWFQGMNTRDENQRISLPQFCLGFSKWCSQEKIMNSAALQSVTDYNFILFTLGQIFQLIKWF